MAWVLQNPGNYPCTIHYDNMTIGQHAAGTAQWTPTWEYTRLHAILTALRHLLHMTVKLPSFTHVKSHMGHPWNEAVDSVAKAVAKRIIPGVTMPTKLALLMQQPQFEWAWMYLQPSYVAPRPHSLRAVFSTEGPFEQQFEDTTWWQPKICESHSHVDISSVVSKMFSRLNRAPCDSSKLVLCNLAKLRVCRHSMMMQRYIS